MTPWLIVAQRKTAILDCDWCGATPCECMTEGYCPVCDVPMGEYCGMTCGLTWDMYDDVWMQTLRAREAELSWEIGL